MRLPVLILFISDEVIETKMLILEEGKAEYLERNPRSTREINYGNSLTREIPHQTWLRFFSGERQNALAPPVLPHPCCTTDTGNVRSRFFVYIFVPDLSKHLLGILPLLLLPLRGCGSNFAIIIC